MLKDLRNARKGRGRRREEEEMNRQPQSDFQRTAMECGGERSATPHSIGFPSRRRLRILIA
jgi:hypothetical protein